ncbi:hypothetical protein [Vreelandella sp. EE27]
MQRALREEGMALVEPLQPERLQRLVHRYCPPSIGNLFATPRSGQANGLEWWTELTGQPRALAELSPQEQEALKKRATQRLSALDNLIGELENRGDEAATALRQLPTTPNTEQLYSVNGEPLLIRWVPTVATGATPAAARPTVAAPLKPAATQTTTLWWWRRTRWLVPFLLLPLLGLALLGFWLAFSYWDRFKLPWLNNDTQVLPFACRADSPPPPEFFTIFDTSGSMNLNIETTQEDERWFFDMPDLLRQLRANDPRMQRLMAGPSRLDVAQGGFTGLINAIDPDIDIGLITYQGCEMPVMQGVFSAEQRPQLVAGIHQLTAYAGTPLAASLLQAARAVDGQQRDAIILAFVDGADGCGQNHCAVAQEIASRQPRLKINVVDISNSGLSDCIAQQTGGRVFGSQDADMINTMLMDAGREALSDEYCRL